MTPEQKTKAQLILEEMNREGQVLPDLMVSYEESNKAIKFQRDRRIATIPDAIVDKKAWSDVRFLFRSCLGKDPAVWNHTAPNDWD